MSDQHRAGFCRVTDDSAGPGRSKGRVAVTVELDRNALGSYTDQHLAALWHTVQAAPAPYGDSLAADVVESLTYEIIRRWLATPAPQMFKHRPGSYALDTRGAFARYRPGGGADDWDGEFENGVWAVRGTVIDAILAGPPAGTRCPYCGNDGTVAVPVTTTRTTDILDKGAPGLARVEYGEGAGEVWICRDSEACKRRLWELGRSDDSQVCARCNRLPGVAAAPTELHQVETEDGPRWVCCDVGRCDRRVARGARPPYRFDKKAQADVAALNDKPAGGTGKP